jgi:hypothetical protein
MKLFSKACIVLALVVLVGCGGNGGDGSADAGDTEGANTVTHSGTITKVDADGKSITVDVKEKGTMEFAFADSTKVLHRYQEVPFDSLRADRQVGVEVEEGSTTPMKVNIAN